MEFNSFELLIANHYRQTLYSYMRYLQYFKLYLWITKACSNAFYAIYTFVSII